MELLINLPDNFKNLSEAEKLKILSAKIRDIDSQSINPENKWQKFAQELKEKSILSGGADFVLKQSKEFRTDFSFKHDIVCILE